jgi:peptidoglycan-associated lipoprotein
MGCNVLRSLSLSRQSYGSAGAWPLRASRALALMALLPVGAALADREPRRISPVLADGRMPASTAQDEAEAQQAYEGAITDLGRGRGIEGQRRLEQLIVRFPDSPQADAARARLARIYQAVAQGGPRSSLGVPPSETRPATTGGWSVDVARVSPLAEAFRNEVGDRVFFAPGSAELGMRARDVLRRQAEWLAARPNAVIRIEGHADDPGSPADNRQLAERRAETVLRALIADGVAARRIRTEALGREARIALCRDPACSAQNRRAVTVIEVSSTAIAEQQMGGARRH